MTVSFPVDAHTDAVNRRSHVFVAGLLTSANTAELRQMSKQLIGWWWGKTEANRQTNTLRRRGWRGCTHTHENACAREQTHLQPHTHTPTCKRYYLLLNVLKLVSSAFIILFALLSTFCDENTI